MTSAAFLLGENQGLGIQASVAQLLVRRLIADAAWSEVGCLVVDLPPGTADIQQFVFGLGARPVFVVVVVTPQVIAHQDARRLIADLERHSVVSVGGVENMSGQICPSCGKTTELFPAAPPEESIWGLVPRLASMPFSAAAARDADRGLPVWSPAPCRNWQRPTRPWPASCSGGSAPRARPRPERAGAGRAVRSRA